MRLTESNLLDPVLLFLLSLMGGTLWFLMPTGDNLAIAAKSAPAATKAVPERAPADSVARDDERAAWATAIAGLRLQRTSLQTQKSAVKKEIAELDAAIAAQRGGTEPETSGGRTDQLGQLANSLAAKLAEIEKMTNELDRESRNTESGPVSAPRTIQTAKKAVGFHIVGNRVLPIDLKYYNFRVVRVGGRRIAIGSRKIAGDSPADLAKPESVSARAVAEIKPAEQYVACLVDEKSFEAFRTLRKLARARDIEVGWQPYKEQDGEIIMSLSGGGRGILPQGGR